MRVFASICLFWLLPSYALAQSVRVDWNEVTEDTSGNPEVILAYRVCYGDTQGGPYPNCYSTAIPTLQVDNLDNNTPYYFVVIAIDQALNESAPSDEVTYTIPAEVCDNLIDDDGDQLIDCFDDECAPRDEACDGFDNDCNGTVDDLTGAACPLQGGVCAGSTQVCGGASGWLECGTASYGADYQADETRCDGLDNDCDDEVDEVVGQLCPLQYGVCENARQPCNGSAGFGDCSEAYGSDYHSVETAEHCDGLDNDCDTLVDEECPCTPAAERSCSVDVGVCQVGTQTCDANGAWGACSGVLPSEEICDGLDNNCDNQVDNIFSPPLCPQQDGVCAGSVQTCGGQSGWQACGTAEYGAQYEAQETSCDQLDNDCDGQVDEGDVCGSSTGDSDSPAGDADNYDDLKIKGSCGCDSASQVPFFGVLLLLAWGLGRAWRRRHPR